MLDAAWEVVKDYAETPGASGVADTHKGGPLRSHMGRNGLPVTLISPSSTIDMQRCVGLRQRLEEESITLHDAELQLVRDLKRVRVGAAGKIVFPRESGGGHCDCGQALLAAAHAHGSRRGAPQGRPGPRPAMPRWGTMDTVTGGLLERTF
jgi:hypothetical protein